MCGKGESMPKKYFQTILVKSELYKMSSSAKNIFLRICKSLSLFLHYAYLCYFGGEG